MEHSQLPAELYAKIPPELRGIPLDEMAYVAPGAFVVDEDGYVWVQPFFYAYPRATGSATIPIIVRQNGAEVDYADLSLYRFRAEMPHRYALNKEGRGDLWRVSIRSTATEGAS